MLKLLNFSCSRCSFPDDHSDHFLVNINRTAGHSTAATQNVCRTAGHLPLVHLGIHPGHYRRMRGGNSYVFEISGGNSHTIQQVPSRKRTRIRHSFSNERKPSVIEKHAGSRLPTHGGQLPIGLEKHTAQHWPSQSARTPASRSPSGRVPDASPQ